MKYAVHELNNIEITKSTRPLMYAFNTFVDGSKVLSSKVPPIPRASNCYALHNRSGFSGAQV